MNRLEINNLEYGYYGENVIQDINMKIDKGEFVGIIGGNGSGKSTILKCIYGALKPRKGVIYIDNTDIMSMSSVDIARKIAVVSQENDMNFDFSVEEMVLMGRIPHKTFFQADTNEDIKITIEALQKTGMYPLKDRSFKSLSGGEKQRVIIARAIAQQADLMILDEPTNHLDICYQLQIFETVKSLGITVLAAIHDLNLASLYCDRIYALKNGNIFARGTPEEILTVQFIRELFGVECEIGISKHTGKTVISYIPGNILGDTK